MIQAESAIMGSIVPFECESNKPGEFKKLCSLIAVKTESLFLGRLDKAHID